MKILLTTPTYPPFNSGLGNAVQSQARILVNANHIVEVATGGKVTQLKFDDTLRIKIHEFNIQGAQSLLNPIKGDIKAYKSFLQSSNFDILIMNGWQTWSTDVPLSMLENFSGRKFLYSHGISTNLVIQGDYLRSILRYIIWRPYWFRLKQSMRKLDGLFFVAERGVDSRFDDLIFAKKLKINSYIAYNCISDETLNFLELPSRSFDDRSGLISVGSYTWFKGHDFVLKAYAKSKYKNKIPLSIFGQKFTPYTDELRVLASNLDIQNAMINFHEGISGDKLLRRYSDSSIFICGSYTECQPLVLLDAMATGTPFVSRASGCIPFMTGGISVRDIDSAAIAINELMDNPKMWRIFSMKGRIEIARNHHPDQLSAMLLKGISPIQKGVP